MHSTEDINTEIKLIGIKKTYVMGEVEVPVLRGIDLEIAKGEITVILGASGSGKSTLLNIIGGIDKPSAGEVWFEKKNLAILNDRKLTEYRRKNIGFVFQFYNLVASLTARENIQVATEIADNPMDSLEALKILSMSDKENHFPAQLSGGEQQRVAIARALSKKPVLMLCDEPTGALDYKTGQIVIDKLIDLNEKLATTIVIITHCAPLAAMAHRVIKIGSGVITDNYCNKKRATAKEITW